MKAWPIICSCLFLVVVLLNPKNPMGDAYSEEEFKQILAKAKEAQAQCCASFRKVYDAGVLCILGSDSGTQFCRHADSLYEMVIMVEDCGLTPAEALKIGTINSAIACEAFASK